MTADVLRDVAKFIYILKNYGGQDLGEFIKDLKEHMAIKVTTDGGVDKLQADLNIDAVMAFLDMLPSTFRSKTRRSKPNGERGKARSKSNYPESHIRV